MIYNIWFVGMILTFLILKVGFIGVHVEWKINDADLSKLGEFIVCLIASIFWPITWVVIIIDLFYDSNS